MARIGTPRSPGFDGRLRDQRRRLDDRRQLLVVRGERLRLNATTGFQRLTFGTAYDVSYDGSVVVGTGAVLGLAGGASAPTGGRPRPARGRSGDAQRGGCSSDGAVVVGYADGLVPFRWSVSGGLQSLLGTWVSGTRSGRPRTARRSSEAPGHRRSVPIAGSPGDRLALPAGATTGAALAVSGSGELIGGTTYTGSAPI